VGDDVETRCFYRGARLGRKLTGDSKPASRAVAEPGAEPERFLDRDRLAKAKVEVGRDTEDPGHDDSSPGHDFVEGGGSQATMEDSEGSSMKRARNEPGGNPSGYFAEVVDPESRRVSTTAGETSVVVVTTHLVN
jgi:hypothetical protein